MKKRRRRKNVLMKNNTANNKALIKKKYVEQVQLETNENAQSSTDSTRLSKALAEINKRLVNQRGLWTCLASGISLGSLGE